MCIGAAVICTALFAFTTTWTMGLISLMIYSVATPIATLMVPLLSFSLFGYKAQKEYAGIYGIIAMSMSVGSFITTPVWGVVYDTAGSYRPGFLVMPVLISVACALQLAAIHLQEKAKR